MNTQQIANRLVGLCRQNKNAQALDELYHNDIESEEMFEMPPSPDKPDMPRVMKGIAAIRGKTDWWYDTHITHSGECSEPLVAGNHFAVKFKYDVTFKPRDQRMQFEEIAVYEVKDGKIWKEKFFYSMG